MFHYVSVPKRRRNHTLQIVTRSPYFVIFYVISCCWLTKGLYIIYVGMLSVQDDDDENPLSNVMGSLRKLVLGLVVVRHGFSRLYALCLRHQYAERDLRFGRQALIQNLHHVLKSQSTMLCNDLLRCLVGTLRLQKNGSPRKMLLLRSPQGV